MIIKAFVEKKKKFKSHKCATQFDHQYSESGGLDFEFFLISKMVYLKNKVNTLLQHYIIIR